MRIAWVPHRRVPLARRNLLAEPRRLVAGIAGIGLALMLIGLLGGLWAGIQTQSVQYLNATGAALGVLPPGTRTLFAEGTELPTSTLRTVRATPGVDWAAPAWGLFAILNLHNARAAVVLVGSTPGQPGGAWALARGHAPAADDEVAIDRVLAAKHGLNVGDRLPVADRSYRIVGITRHAGFMTGYVFATHHAVEVLLGAPGKTNAILVGSAQPAAVRARLAATGLAVLDTPELRRTAIGLNTKVFGPPLRLMVAIAFAAGVLIVALTVYAQVAERRREYGIWKALGASGRRLTMLALAQTLVLSALGLVVGGLLLVAGRALLALARPQFEVVITPGLLLEAVGAALVMALLAAIVPARRLARLNPATAYRGA
ncbi:MAG TPA: ABC transporter permease [Actinomycetes bacterium]|nr:ABC transporter permease [Actinomycetes bacterium]